jgi:NADPH:quinone reductase
MKAIQIQSHGGLEVLRVTTLPDPEPGADELLVRIKASAVNPLRGRQRGSSPLGQIMWWRCLTVRWPSKCKS